LPLLLLPHHRHNPPTPLRKLRLKGQIAIILGFQLTSLRLSPLHLLHTHTKHSIMAITTVIREVRGGGGGRSEGVGEDERGGGVDARVEGTTIAFLELLGSQLAQQHTKKINT